MVAHADIAQTRTANHQRFGAASLSKHEVVLWENFPLADPRVGASSNVVSRAYDRATVMSDSPISHRREFEWLHDPNQSNTHRRFVGASSSNVCNRIARNVSPSIGASSNENLTTLTVSM